MAIIQKLEPIHLSTFQKEVANFMLDKKLEIEKMTINELLIHHQPLLLLL